MLATEGGLHGLQTSHLMSLGSHAAFPTNDPCWKRELQPEALTRVGQDAVKHPQSSVQSQLCGNDSGKKTTGSFHFPVWKLHGKKTLPGGLFLLLPQFLIPTFFPIVGASKTLQEARRHDPRHCAQDNGRNAPFTKKKKKGLKLKAGAWRCQRPQTQPVGDGARVVASAN